MSRLAAIQQIYTRYKAIADDTLYLGDGRPRAIFEVHPPNLALADADTLESTAQQLAVVFNSLPFAFQLLFRLVAVDLEDHAAEAELAAASRDPELAAGARLLPDHPVQPHGRHEVSARRVCQPGNSVATS